MAHYVQHVCDTHRLYTKGIPYIGSLYYTAQHVYYYTCTGPHTHSTIHTTLHYTMYIHTSVGYMYNR